MVEINWSNVSNFNEIPNLANTVSNNTFWVGMLFMIYAIMILMMLVFGFETAILVASFLGLVIALMMAYAGLIAWSYVLIFVGTLIFMFFYIIWSSQKVRYS